MARTRHFATVGVSPLLLLVIFPAQRLSRCTTGCEPRSHWKQKAKAKDSGWIPPHPHLIAWVLHHLQVTLITTHQVTTYRSRWSAGGVPAPSSNDVELLRKPTASTCFIQPNGDFPLLFTIIHGYNHHKSLVKPEPFRSARYWCVREAIVATLALSVAALLLLGDLALGNARAIFKALQWVRVTTRRMVDITIWWFLNS